MSDANGETNDEELANSIKNLLGNYKRAGYKELHSCMTDLLRADKEK